MPTSHHFTNVLRPLGAFAATVATLKDNHTDVKKRVNGKQQTIVLASRQQRLQQAIEKSTQCAQLYKVRASHSANSMVKCTGTIWFARNHTCSKRSR
jgi:hypothetical protein